eukprot:TRINITY_DN50576_c0_g1_i1.p1 TRINITY_DN50576_c0_g1~~TRINITY_DN50576_c0_g1_i1.p1  ORF type:complete len:179 (-),score=25.10 TRINITY_DN50576_c0_g1_i1:166-702(-)
MRSALPHVLKEFPDVCLGSFTALSCPHLGIKAAPGAPLRYRWRNAAGLLRCWTQQQPQLILQDDRQYLATELVNDEHLEALASFDSLTVASLSNMDLVVPPASGLIQDPEAPSHDRIAFPAGSDLRLRALPWQRVAVPMRKLPSWLSCFEPCFAALLDTHCQTVKKRAIVSSLVRHVR